MIRRDGMAVYKPSRFHILLECSIPETESPLTNKNLMTSAGLQYCIFSIFWPQLSLTFAPCTSSTFPIFYRTADAALHIKARVKIIRSERGFSNKLTRCRSVACVVWTRHKRALKIGRSSLFECFCSIKFYCHGKVKVLFHRFPRKRGEGFSVWVWWSSPSFSSTKAKSSVDHQKDIVLPWMIQSIWDFWHWLI